MNIKLHAPAMLLFLISLVLAVLALVGYFVVIPYITMYGFWIAMEMLAACAEPARPEDRPRFAASLAEPD